MRTWYYEKGGEKQGPVSEDELVHMFEIDGLNADTLVWTEELTEWTAARNIENLVPEKPPQKITPQFKIPDVPPPSAVVANTNICPSCDAEVKSDAISSPLQIRRLKLKFLLVGCGTLILILTIAVVVGVVWLFFGPEYPESGVQLPNSMESYATKYIMDNKILDNSEDILAYYDVTVSLNGTEAAILSTKRIIYHKDGNNDSINISDIENIRHRNGMLTGDVIEITSIAGKTIKIEIAPLNQGETFLNVLMNVWKKEKKKTM
jgi:hypothetical protein